MKTIKIIIFLVFLPVAAFSADWIVMNPTQPANHLYAIWGSAADDIFTVGAMGIIRHFDGASWSNMQSDTASDLYSIWGSSGTDVFAVGKGGMILHYDGITWAVMTTWKTENLRGVWGSSKNDVFAVGSNGTILHYDGRRWSAMRSGSSNDLYSIWGNSQNDVFAVGKQNTILHYNGKSWSFMSIPDITNPYYSFISIGGRSGTDVFVISDSGQIFRYDGSNWNPFRDYYSPLSSIWSKQGLDIFAVGFYGVIIDYHCQDMYPCDYSCCNWYSKDSTTDAFLNGVWGTSNTNIYAVGSYGTIIHYDGSKWDFVNNLPTNNLNDIWGVSENDVYAVGNRGTILHYDGTNWSRMNSGTTAYDIQAIWGASATDVYAVGYYYNLAEYPEGNGYLLHYDGVQWSPIWLGSGLYLRDIWGSSAQDIYIIGWSFDLQDYAIWHYDGLGWRIIKTGETLYGLWGIDKNNIFVFSEYDLLRFDGANWSLHSHPPNGIIDLWGTSANELFAVYFRSDGSGGSIAHYDGMEWSPMDILTEYFLTSIWGSSANDVFAAGPGGIIHYDGFAWSPMTIKGATENSSSPYQSSPHQSGGSNYGVLATTDVGGIWGSSANNVFAVGAGGTILHYPSSVTDSDHDGIDDEVDQCVDSNLETTIIIGGCNSGVPNELFPEGCTMSDQITQCTANLKTQGAFVKCVYSLATGWKKSGYISGKEKNMIVSCAARAGVL